MQLMAFVLISVIAFPSTAIAREGDPRGLMRSGVAAVARMSDLRPDSVAARAQRSQVNNNKKTTIILVTVAAAAIVALILIPYEKSHAHGPVGVTLGPF